MARLLSVGVVQGETADVGIEFGEPEVASGPVVRPRGPLVVGTRRGQVPHRRKPVGPVPQSPLIQASNVTAEPFRTVTGNSTTGRVGARSTPH